MFGGFLKLLIKTSTVSYPDTDNCDPIYVFLQHAEGMKDQEGRTTEMIGKLEYYETYSDFLNSGTVWIIFR